MGFIKTLIVQEFEWDEGNLTHILGHNITADEIEEAYFEDQSKKTFFDEVHSTRSENRYIVLAMVPSTQKLLKFVFTQRRKKIRVVTAYECSKDKKLVEIYYQKAG